MSLFEQYAMGIPILVPSPEFLWELHDELDLVAERTWDRVIKGQRSTGSVIPGHAGTTMPDPNDDKSKEAFLYWAQFGDYYQFPHIVQFSSWEDLKPVVDTTDWAKVSRGMKAHFEVALEETMDEYSSLLPVPSSARRHVFLLNECIGLR
eukprot:scaffold2418_cov175-Amphora_coffeaeformis.AAC.6